MTVKFGERQGTTPTGVVAYSNEHSNHFSGEKHHHKWQRADGGAGTSTGGSEPAVDVFTGYRWQCVEFARRYLLQVHDTTFASTNTARGIWWGTKFYHLRSAEDARNPSNAVDVVKVGNGTGHRDEDLPVVGSLLIYAMSIPRCPWGHVAVVTEVNVAEGWVRIADQNAEFHDWTSASYSKQLPLVRKDARAGRGWFSWLRSPNPRDAATTPDANGCWYLHDEDAIIGWITPSTVLRRRGQ